MIAWTIAQIALLGTLLALAAWGAECALRTARRPTRWPWVAALLLTLVLGALAPLQVKSAATVTPTLAITPTAVTSQPTAAPTDIWSTLSALWADLGAQAEAMVQRGWSAWHAGTPGSIGAWLLAAWVVVSVALLLAFATVHWRYQRRRAQWPLHTVRGTTVRVAHDTGPAVIGVTDTEIVVPAWLLERDTTEQELVLAHELEHVRVHDPLLLAVAQAAVVLLPWHPAVWWMASRLRLAVELDCDARVLARGATARDYGALLIDLTDHRAGFGAALPAFSCRPSHLERRLVAMTPKRLKYPMVRALSTGALASLALLAACEAKLPTSEEVDNMTATTALTKIAGSGAIDTNGLTFYLDDQKVDYARVSLLPPEQISSVSVLQRNAGAPAQVHVVLRKDDSTATKRPLTVRYNGIDTAEVSVATGKDTTTFRRWSGTTDVARHVATENVRKAEQNQSREPFTGLFIVDGVARESNTMNTIAPDQIVSVNVIKGPAATAKYSDPRAANGVIEIVTKKPKP